MGKLRWSLRQMWSVVYNQTMRKMASQRAIRIIRLLGLRKGTFMPGYMQLYMSFDVSSFVYQLQMFMDAQRHGRNSVLHVEPVAITTAVDRVQQLWQQ
ncbi:hypothetical protein EJ02DRAFT_51677 [Clathrospora elynae]|uniref:Wax synthase domain-containing protein n=1 Tax=Clathrospora elynae TaxID=706981 RepID=A0A6A5SX73_9PLEO|nr:hypothetical protein EJ02DRAFT_51677 [Clathrospora elynae]